MSSPITLLVFHDKTTKNLPIFFMAQNTLPLALACDDLSVLIGGRPMGLTCSTQQFSLVQYECKTEETLVGKCYSSIKLNFVLLLHMTKARIVAVAYFHIDFYNITAGQFRHDQKTNTVEQDCAEKSITAAILPKVHLIVKTRYQLSAKTSSNYFVP